MRDTCVFDLDGTLANVGHRRHLVSGKKKDFDAFHALLSQDPVNEWCAELMKRMAAGGYRIIIVSARPKSVLEETHDWLLRHRVTYHEIYLLRPDGDSTPDQELKMQWLGHYGKDRVLFVVDDRQKVVDAWRAAGVTCLQCDDWSENPK